MDRPSGNNSNREGRMKKNDNIQQELSRMWGVVTSYLNALQEIQKKVEELEEQIKGILDYMQDVVRPMLKEVEKSMKEERQ